MYTNFRIIVKQTITQARTKTKTMSDQTVSILLVEDDDIDIEAVRRGFRKHKIANPFLVAKDGVEALALLREGIEYPFLILLDLNMPRMNGIGFLKELRNDPALKTSIVFVLTTSSDERDRWAAYEQNIAGYLLKSQVGKDFVHIINMLDLYWRYVEFPPQEAPEYKGLPA